MFIWNETVREGCVKDFGQQDRWVQGGTEVSATEKEKDDEYSDDGYEQNEE